MRISDWSSDVCSSDLRFLAIALGGAAVGEAQVDRRERIAAADPSGQRIGRGRPAWPKADSPLAATRASAMARHGCRFDHRPRIGGQHAGRVAIAGNRRPGAAAPGRTRSEEHTSELQSLMRNSYAVFCLKKKKTT